MIVSSGTSSGSFTSCLIMLPMNDIFFVPWHCLHRKQDRVYHGSSLLVGWRIWIHSKGSTQAVKLDPSLCSFRLLFRRVCGTWHYTRCSLICTTTEITYQPCQPQGQPNLPPSSSDANFPHAVKLAVNTTCL